MATSARLRHELARRPWIYWAVVAGTVAIAVFATLDLTARVEAERARWGETVRVVVATATVDAGAPLAPLVEHRRYPTAMVPVEALASVDDAMAARRRIGAGEIVTSSDVAPDTSPASLARPGEVIVAVSEPVPSGALVGERVIIASEGVVLADDALVVGTSLDVVLVAVERSSAPMVAATTGSPAGVSLLRVP